MNAAKTGTAGNWMDMTISDWLDLAPSEWMDQAMPGWRERSYAGYGDIMRTSPRDWFSMMYGPFASQTPLPAVRPLRGHPRHEHRWGCHEGRARWEHHHRHHRDQGCRHCGPDPCECFCCIGDVDLVVYTRVGEQRVIPITVENERRREQEVKLELSDWTTRGGTTGVVETIVIEPTEFTLAPCGVQEITVVVRMLEKADAGTQAKKEDAAAERRRLSDVDSCEVVTADLRLIGCERRSLRIAAAVLPRDCDPFRVSCGCTCC